MNKPDLFDSEKLHSAIREELDDELRFVSTFVREQVQPAVEASTEIVKNLVTLSAGAVVASVSVAQIIHDESPDVDSFVWLLPLSWVLFVLVVIIGLSRIGSHATVKSYGWVLYSQRGAILDSLDKLITPEAAHEQMHRMRNDAIARADALIERMYSRERVLGPAMGLIFVLGVFSLVLFAILNLPL
jgi:hypothetical protein